MERNAITGFSQAPWRGVWPAEEGKKKRHFCRNLVFISLVRKEVARGRQLRVAGCVGKQKDSEPKN